MSVEYVKEADFISEPIYQTDGSVGSDLFSTEKYSLFSMKPTLVNCGFSIKIPIGYFGLVSGRSSLALKGVLAHVGIIDDDYRNCVCIILMNLNADPYNIEIGDRIGQITLVKFVQAAFQKRKELRMLFSEFDLMLKHKNDLIIKASYKIIFFDDENELAFFNGKLPLITRSYCKPEEILYYFESK